MPSELKARIEDGARANNRSINAEIVHRLDASFDDALTIGQGYPMPEGAAPLTLGQAVLAGLDAFDVRLARVEEALRAVLPALPPAGDAVTQVGNDTAPLEQRPTEQDGS